MNPVLDDGYGGYLVLLGIVLLAHEPWRWLGFALGRNLSVDSQMFIWVRSVATALVAGLVMKLVVFPAGTLAAVPAWVRVAAMAGAVAAFYGGRRSLGLGVATGAALIAALQWLRVG